MKSSELLIIIPAFNESGNIQKTIKMIKTHTPEFDYVIVVKINLMLLICQLI